MATQTTQKRIEVVGVSHGLATVEKEIRSVASAQDELAKSSEVSARVTETSARRQTSVAGSYDRLRKQIDQTYRVQQKLADGQRKIDRAFEQGVIDLQEYEASLDKLQAHFMAANDNALELAARVHQLSMKFDEGYASAKRMDGELAELAEAERLGIRITGGYSAALDGLIKKYDAASSAAARRTQELQELAQAERLAASSSDGQAKWNAYAGVADGVRKSARDAAAVFEEAAAEAEALEKRVASLRAQLNPAGAALDRMNAELAEYSALAARGAIGSEDLARAQAMAKARYNETTEAINRQGNAVARAASSFNTSNLAAQGFDIVATAGFMPWYTVALQQGPQVAQVFNDIKASGSSIGPAVSAAFMQLLNPISLVTYGVIALGAAAIQWFFSAKSESEKFDEVLQKHAETVDHLKRLYGEAAEAADNLASAGGQAFSSAIVRNDVSALRRELQRQAESVSGEMRGDGILTRGLFGSLADVRDLQSVAGQFKDQVDALVQSAAAGSVNFAAFNASLDAAFDAARKSGEGVTELHNQIEVLRETAQSAFQVSGKFSDFTGPINQLQAGIAAGRIDLVKFNSEVEKIGRQKGIEDLADQLIVLGANLVKVFTALESVERARFRATEQIRERLASERNDVGQSYYQDRERQWELENRILDAQTKQLRALTDQEKVAAAGELARARNPVVSDEQRREIAVAERQERERLDQQAREAAVARERERSEALVGAREELSLIGVTIGEAARLRYEYAEMAKLREQAAKTGRAADEAEIDAIRQKAEEIGRYAEEVASAAAMRDLMFEREQMARSPVDQRVASQMRDLYGDEYKSHMDDAIADQIRLNDQWRTAQDELQEVGDIGANALGGLLDILYESGDATEQLMKLFANIGKQFAQMGLDRMIGNLKAGKSIFDLSGFGGRSAADTKASAIAIGREIGGAVAPTVTTGFKSGLDVWAAGIRKIESGSYAGNYGAVGPVTSRGDRAYGAYQVMGANISTWTKEVLGQSLSIKEFLADQSAQDKIFYAKFSQSADKFGSMADATSVWFSGRPISRAGNASDGYNTVPQYVGKVQSAVDAYPGSLRQGVSDGVVDANRRVQQNATMQGMDSPGATGQMGKLEALLGLGGAAFGAFAGGYQSGNPLMGGLSGAMSGFGAAPALSALGLGSAAGPIGIIGGAVLGILGGIFGRSRQKRKEKEQARAELESQRGAIQSLIDAAMGTPSGESESAWRQMSDEIAKARKLASKAGDSALVKELDLASETFFNFLVDDWRRGLDGVMKAMESGHGMDGAFVRAQKAISDLSDTLVGFVKDAEWFAETGGDYEKAKLTKKEADNATGTSAFKLGQDDDRKRYYDPISQDYRTAVTRYADELKKLGIEAFTMTGPRNEQYEVAAFSSVDALMKKMTDLGVVFDDLGNILTADQIKERLEREKELQRAIEGAQKAAQEMALRQLTGAEEFTQIETAIQTLEGTAAGLQTTLEKLGMTADEAADAIAKGLSEALKKLRDDYVKDLTRSINELSGAGYINDVMDAMKLYEERLKDSKALGIDTSMAFTELTLSLREISREAGLSGDDLKYLAKLFPDLAKVFKGISPSGGIAEAQAAVDRAKADLRSAYDEEARAIEGTISRLKSFISSIEKFKVSLKLDDQLSPLSPFDKFAEAQKRFQEVSQKALAGDETAMGELEDVSRQYLEEARAYYASSEQYFAIFTQVEAILDQALSSAKGQLSTSEQQLVTLKDQVSKLIDINDSVMSVADAIAALQSSIDKLDGLGGSSEEFDPSKHWSKSVKDFYGQLQAYKKETGSSVAPAEIASVWSAFASAGSGKEYDMLARAYTEILKSLMPKSGLQFGGIVGAYADGGIVGNGIYDRDSVLARYAGGGNIALAGGEFVTRATSVNNRTSPTLDYINRTGSLPGNDNSALIAELRAELRALRAEVREGNERQAHATLSGAREVASAVESGTRATEDLGRKIRREDVRRAG